MARRARVEPTEDWEQIKLLLKFPEQLEYERIRPPVVFGASVAERSRQTGTPESTLHRKISGFEKDGMRSLFETERVEPRGGVSLDPEVRGLILDLKSEYPPMRNNEIATICHVRFGRRPHGRTVERILRENPASIRMFRRFGPYHEILDAADRRLAIVALHSEGWNVKSIAGYLKTYRSTVYRTLKRWIAEGVHGLEDKPRSVVRKVDLHAMNEIRKFQENPELGEFRVSAALERLGILLSPRTCGHILAAHRRIYGLKKPKRGSKEKKECPSSLQGGTRSGAWTSVAWTIGSRRTRWRREARSKRSVSSRTIRGHCSRAPSPPARTRPPTSRFSTQPSNATVHRRFWSATGAPSSAPTRQGRSTALWA